MDIHIYLHTANEEKLEKLIRQLITKVDNMDANTQAALDKLNNAVTRETSVGDSVVALLNGLSAQILDLKNQPGNDSAAVVAALESAAALLTADTDKVSAAVVANTPSA